MTIEYHGGESVRSDYSGKNTQLLGDKNVFRKVDRVLLVRKQKKRKAYTTRLTDEEGRKTSRALPKLNYEYQTRRNLKLES